MSVRVLAGVYYANKHEAFPALDLRYKGATARRSPSAGCSQRRLVALEWQHMGAHLEQPHFAQSARKPGATLGVDSLLRLLKTLSPTRR